MSYKAKKILIIDDDPRNIFALKATLNAKGFDCISGGGMQDAFHQLREGHNIGVILLDMMMPDMDGYEGIAKIRESGIGTPVVAVTAQAMAGDREKCIKAGADAYISKPIDTHQLMILVNQYLK